MYKLNMIDALGPFFIHKPERDVVNWSKVIFSDLETDGHLSDSTKKHIIANFDSYIKHVAELGYDSISIDDLAHLVVLPFYHSSLQTLLKDYHSLYKELFAIAVAYDMKIFVNTDYLFFNDDIREYLTANQISTDDFYLQVLETAMQKFPEIDGVILRIGEMDGKDVSGSFLSKILLHTPKQANQLLQKVLPLFERYSKTLIFRTWTIGAYRIGDLIWNEKTYDAVFASIKSEALVISMKFGDTDFMRYLSLNPLFFRGPHKKMIELQTRREWEGMGMYPSFVGWDYSNYLNKLAAHKSIVGIHVWCQTGGWAKKEWSNLTYLEGSSFWNELNTEVTISMARHQRSIEEAIGDFCKRRGIANVEAFTELLRYSDIAIKHGFYSPELARQELYFRRSRIPPLMWLTWDRVYLSPVVVYLHRMLLPRPSTLVEDGDRAVEAASMMLIIAKELKLDKKILDSLSFEHDSLVVFAELRRYIFRTQSSASLQKLNRRISQYKTMYPQHYSIPDLGHVKRRRLPRALLKPFVRETVKYRKRDKIFLKTSPLQARIVRYYLRHSRPYLSSHTMSVEVLFDN